MHTQHHCGPGYGEEVTLYCMAKSLTITHCINYFKQNLLSYILVKYNINGNIYKCIKAMYYRPLACVEADNNITERFDVSSAKSNGNICHQY